MTMRSTHLPLLYPCRLLDDSRLKYDVLRGLLRVVIVLVLVLWHYLCSDVTMYEIRPSFRFQIVHPFLVYSCDHPTRSPDSEIANDQISHVANGVVNGRKTFELEAHGREREENCAITRARPCCAALSQRVTCSSCQRWDVVPTCRSSSPNPSPAQDPQYRRLRSCGQRRPPRQSTARPARHLRQECR